MKIDSEKKKWLQGGGMDAYAMQWSLFADIFNNVGVPLLYCQHMQIVNAISQKFWGHAMHSGTKRYHDVLQNLFRHGRLHSGAAVACISWGIHLPGLPGEHSTSRHR